MTEGRRRVRARFGIVLEPEVQTLGPVEIPAEWRLS
jgi:UDP-N-acetylenolpyruvoylglucosamine reductase